MTAIVLAQATAPTHVVRIEKPANDAALTIRLDGVLRLDLRAIAAEQITLVRVGDSLVILFDNKATVTLEPFFAADGTPRDDLAVQLGPDRIVNGDQFATLFPVSDDAAVLPAAGDGPTGGGFTTTFSIDSLDGRRNALALLQRDLAALTGTGADEEEQVDLPVDSDVDILGPAEAALTELADTTSAETIHTVTGVLEFSGDATDTGHSAVVTGVAATGETAGLPDDALLAAFMNIDGVTPVPGTNGGTIDWRFAAPDRAFDYLAAGETATLAYHVTLTDAKGASDSDTVTVTVTGSNDRPDFNAAMDGAVTERIDTTNSEALDDTAGTLGFTDVDLNDVGHSAVVTLAAASGNLGNIKGDPAAWFSIDSVAKAAGNNTGVVNWSFAAPDMSFDYLAAGQQLFLDYTVEMNDGDGGAATATQRIVITGANDAPMLFGHINTLGIGEDTFTANAGTIGFKDPDMPDAHVLSFAPQNGGVRADGSPYIGTVSLGAITGNAALDFAQFSVGVTVDNIQLQFLAEGQKLSQYYDVTITDSQGGSVTHTVEILLQGDNDGPEFATPLTASLFEAANTTGSTAPLQTSGALAFTDVDLADTGHAASKIGVARSGAAAGLAGVSDDTLLSWFSIDGVTKAGGASTGNVAWSFAAPDRTFDYLAAGQSVTLDYEIQVDDGDGGSDTVVQTVTVTGANDAPVGGHDTVHLLSYSGEQTVRVPTWALLNNDFDHEGSTLTITATASSTPVFGDHMSIHHVATGEVSYWITDGALLGSATLSIERVAPGVAMMPTDQSDVVVSGDAADTLRGAGGNDVLLGGGGNDLLVGGVGRDVMSGGSGADIFRYEGIADGGATSGEADRIVDFNGAEGDIIEILLSGAGFAGAGLPAAGSDATEIFGAGQKFNFDANTLWYDSDGAGGAAAVALAVLENGGTVDATHIRFV